MRNLAFKESVVEELKERFSKSGIAIITDYKSFTVSEMTDLRRRLITNSAELKIAKNTLVKRAIKETSFAELEQLLEGPNALLVSYGDAAACTKTLFDFIKEIEKGEVKGGVYEGKFLNKTELKAFANLPPKEVLYGQIAGLLVANIRDVAGILEGVIRDNALLIEEVAKKNASSQAA